MMDPSALPVLDLLAQQGQLDRTRSRQRLSSAAEACQISGMRMHQLHRGNRLSDIEPVELNVEDVLMSAIPQQFITLLGVLIGALATFTGSTWAERLKWRRTIETRWDEKRFDAYSEYAVAVKRYVTALRRVAGSMGLDSVAHPLDRSFGLSEIDNAEVERAAAFEHVLLLGDQAAVDAARGWHRMAWELAYLIQGINPGGGPEWRAAMEQVWIARGRFYECARLSLGVQNVSVYHNEI